MRARFWPRSHLQTGTKVRTGSRGSSDTTGGVFRLRAVMRVQEEGTKGRPGRQLCRGERGRTTHGLDEVLQTQLDGQGRLSHTTIAKDHNLVRRGKP